MLDLVLDTAAIWFVAAAACVAVDLIPALRRPPEGGDEEPHLTDSK